MKKYEVSPEGYYGDFGGAFVPDALRGILNELSESYRQVMESESFQKEFRHLLRDYVGRPSPLYLARRLSEQYGCRIYLKREDLNHTGAHKINNTIGQALLAKRMGKKRVIAETGAGQHGVATATVCALMGMPCTIYMGQTDMERQRANVEKMRMLGAEVCGVKTGSMTLSDAVDAAIEAWSQDAEETYYLLGSAVGPHPYPDMVARFQSVISEEIRSQLLEQEGREYPDYLVACIGGGSNAAGTIYHYLDDERVRILLAEAGGMGTDTLQTAATITLGEEGVLHGFRSLVLKDDAGEVMEAYSISAGLDYPGIGPLYAYLAKEKRIDVVAVNDDEALKAAYNLTRTEGIIPALESSHALAALEKMSLKPEDVVVLTVSGRGDKDMDTYLKHAAEYV